MITFNKSHLMKNEESAETMLLIAPFISRTIMKIIIKKTGSPRLFTIFFTEVRSLFWVIVFSAFFLFLFKSQGIIHDMFHFIRHSPLLSFDKCQKLHIHTYTYTCIYIDIYKSKNHSSIKIQTARFMYNIILITVVIGLVLKFPPDP